MQTKLKMVNSCDKRNLILKSFLNQYFIRSKDSCKSIVALQYINSENTQFTENNISDMFL